MAEYRDKKDATSRFMVGAILLRSEAVNAVIRREIRRVTDIMVPADTIEKMLRVEVLKREIIEGVQADSASRRVQRCADKTMRKESEHDVDIDKSIDGESQAPSDGMGLIK